MTDTNNRQLYFRTVMSGNSLMVRRYYDGSVMVATCWGTQYETGAFLSPADAERLRDFLNGAKEQPHGAPIEKEF